jgi:carnitine monooxygenase subunit
MNSKIPLREIELEQQRRQQDIETRRAFARHFADGSTGCAASTLTIDPAVYTDTARWEAEKRGIFQQLPLLACLTQDMPNPGDITLFDAAGPSILLVRGKDGIVNAFFNMCMHRASTLADECRKGAKNLSCPYHGWTYDLGGTLIGVPRKADFDRTVENRNLIRVPVGEWGGMIFVKAHAGEERIDVAAYLGETAALLQPMELQTAGPAASTRLEIACNWKYAYDTYTEGYHIGYMHSQTVGAMYIGGVNVIVHRGLHHELDFAAHSLPAGIAAHGPESPELDGTISRILHLFPNVAINSFPLSATERLINIHRVFPGRSVHDCVSLQTSYKYGGHVTDEDRRKYVENHDLIVHVTRDEDFRVCGNSYGNLLSAPPGFQVVFGKNEPITQAMHRNHAIAAGMPLP